MTTDNITFSFMLSDPFHLGRDLTVGEAITIARRATFDPGQFTKRVMYREDEVETLERWQARALVIALGPEGPSHEDKWASVGALGHFTDYERAELALREVST